MSHARVLGRSRGRRAIGTSVALALVLTATALSWGSLCIGADGHVAYEPAASGECVGGASGSAASGGERLGGGTEGAWPCCGPCTDLGGEGADWVRGDSAETGLQVGPVLATTWPATVPPEAVAGARTRHRAEHPIVAHPGRALASVVIRC